MDDKQKSFLDILTSPLTGDYRKKKPVSVKAADVAVGMTPVGSAVDIGEELGKEDPSYAKIGVIAAGDVLGAAIPAVGPVAKSLIKEGVQKLDEVKDLTKNAETNALEEVGLTEESLAAWKEKNYAKDKFRIPPKPELMKAAEDLREGKLSQEEYRKLSSQLQPIVTIEEMPKFPSKEDVIQALHATDKRKVEKGIVGVNKEIPDGTPISARLDIPAYNDTDTWIVSLHDGTEKSGATVGYAQTAVLQDVKFTTNPLAASAIASGKPKTTIARMNGSYINADPDDVYNYTKEILENKTEGWTQVGMNPTRASYFYDKSDGMPVVSADEVVQVGPLVMAKNVKKTTPDDKMFEFTNKRTGVTANFSEGGMAIEEQMEMNFGKVPDNTVAVDPVSGNDIPMGATAENVRDDVPAMLSEGEIVVPADVVNFHGVKLFEDLRAEAKMGYAQMAEDGRMGGQPIDDDNDIGLEFADLEIMIVPDEGMEEEPVEMYRGGMNTERGRGSIYKSYSAPKSSPKPSPKPQRTSSSTAQANRQAAASRSLFRDDDDRPSRPASKPVSYYSPEAISARVQARKDKPKNNFEKFMNLFRDDDDRKTGPQRVYLTEQPATSDDAEGPSILEQINFGGDYDKEYEVTPKKEKKKKTPTIQEDAAKQREEQEKFSVRYDPKPAYQRFLENSGIANMFDLEFDEGGMVPEPFYDQKGGFGELDFGGIQAREYMNDQGQKIIIMFKDGVPMTPIPDGYYPVAETVTPDVDSSYNVDTVRAMTGGGSYAGSAAGVPSSMGASGDGSDPGTHEGLNMATPTPVNYKELSLDELRDLLEDQGSLKQKGILAAASAINPVMALAVRFAMYDTSKKTKAEIERRLESPDTSEVDKMRYTNMLEIAEREEPSLLDRITGKAFEKEYSQIPTPKVPDVDFSDPTLAPDQGIAAPYTPEVTTPSVADPDGITEEMIEAAKEASRIAAINAFNKDDRPEVETVPLVPGTGKTLDELTQPTFQTPTADTQRRKDFGQNVAQNLAGRSTERKTSDAKIATRDLSESEKKGGAALDTRFGISGLDKGGLVEEPKVKEVVKGLKKASKSHAKQADQLEKALKASKKKKKSK